MKAKEYFNKFQTENQDKIPEHRLILAFREMVFEISAIAKARKVKLDSGLIPIFKEQLQKANAFSKMVNETEPFKSEGKLKDDAFKIFLEQDNPSLVSQVWGE